MHSSHAREVHSGPSDFSGSCRTPSGTVGTEPDLQKTRKTARLLQWRDDLRVVRGSSARASSDFRLPVFPLYPRPQCRTIAPQSGGGHGERRQFGPRRRQIAFPAPSPSICDTSVYNTAVRLEEADDMSAMKYATAPLLGVLLLIGCSTPIPRQTEHGDRVLKTGNCDVQVFDAPEPMDGVFSAQRFGSISLPKVEGLLFVRWLNSINIAINCTGAVSIANTPLSLPLLRSVISKAVSDSVSNRPPLEIVIGADENTPFDKVWPVLLTCAGCGICKVGFAVSTGQQEYMNVLRVYVPRIAGTNRPYESPLVLKSETAIAVLGTQTNGITTGRYRAGLVTDRKWIGAEPYPGCIHEAAIPPLGDIDTEKVVGVVTAPGSSYGQVVRLLYWCRRFGQPWLCLFRDDVIPIFEKKND